MVLMIDLEFDSDDEELLEELGYARDSSGVFSSMTLSILDNVYTGPRGAVVGTQ
jgi:hypothetical protein